MKTSRYSRTSTRSLVRGCPSIRLHLMAWGSSPALSAVRYAPDPGRTSTMPRTSRAAIASRRVDLATPRDVASARSGGSRVPTAKFPLVRWSRSAGRRPRQRSIGRPEQSEHRRGSRPSFEPSPASSSIQQFDHARSGREVDRSTCRSIIRTNHSTVVRSNGWSTGRPIDRSSGRPYGSYHRQTARRPTARAPEGSPSREIYRGPSPFRAPSA